jgi:pilus assembly protein CpaB
MVLVALCAGALAALLSYRFLQQERVRASERTRPVPVVLATQDIPARTIIEPNMVSEATRSIATLPPNCASSLPEVVGRATTVALTVGEPIQRTDYSPEAVSLGLAYAVPQGMRAVTVALDSIIGVAGFLKPGDHVDVVATFDVGRFNFSNTAVTRTVLQDVELLAIGPDVRPEEINKPKGNRAAKPKEQPNATLAVSPADAEKLILAESTGRLRLTLRHAGEDRRLQLAGVRSEALMGSSASKPARKPARTAAAPSRPVVVARRAESVETIHGTHKSTVEVGAD